jgi:transposase
MSGKPKPMSQIKQLLRLHQQGKSKKWIARSLGMSKNSIKAYLKKVALSGWSIDALLELDDPVLEGKLFAGNAAYRDERFEQFKSKLDYFESELKRTGVTRRLLWEEYRKVQHDGYGYTQFCFHLSQQLVAANPSMVLEHKAGEKLFIDFAGKKLSYTDPESGEIIECQVFVACLPCSDYSFVLAVRSQSVCDFIYALSRCLEALGGVPATLVPDNLKAAIIKADRYEPDVNRALEDFANHYGITVLPARVSKPKDKALVENQVKLVYSRVYARLRNRQFFSLASLNEAIREKTREHNQTRMQQKPYCREERFLADEKHLLLPLPEQPFELKYYRQLKVAKNNHIFLAQDKHYYSVPYQHIGREIKVIYTRSLVRVYYKDQQIALHPRSYQASGYSTVKEHLCSQHQHYLDRSPGYYLQKAKAKSETFHRLVQLIFEQKRYPEQLYRTCDGLLRLQRKSSPDAFEKACQLAIEHQKYSYRFIQNLLENKMLEPPQNKQDKPLPKHDNVRGKQYYIQSSFKF